MARIDRLKDLRRLLEARRTPVSLRTIMERLQCSESTARRLLFSFRDDFGAPVVYNSTARGWHLDRVREQPADEIPGIWFKPDELRALLVTHELLTQIQPGLLGAEIAPLRERIEEVLLRRGIDISTVGQRVRILSSALREPVAASFAVVATAVMERRALDMGYRGRARATGADADDLRLVSPQRLVWYRSNWYLDAWCHRAEAFRSFAVERIVEPRLQRRPAREFSAHELEAHYDAGYGIFAGPATAIAILRFAPRRAQWVAEEIWHSAQQGHFDAEGYYELRVPYHHPRELLMDVLRFGSDVEVLGPSLLRETLCQILRETLQLYSGPGQLLTG